MFEALLKIFLQLFIRDTVPLKEFHENLGFALLSKSLDPTFNESQLLVGEIETHLILNSHALGFTDSF